METNYLESGHQQPYFNPGGAAAAAAAAPPAAADGSQIELVLSEVRRLEEVAHRNDEELQDHQHQQQMQQLSSDDMVIKSEISQLRQRLAGTDQELQKTNMTLR